jgi:hypothetical protein
MSIIWQRFSAEIVPARNSRTQYVPTFPPSDTMVFQSFRRNNIPAWIARCLNSVQDWAALHGHHYALAGDEFFHLCGPAYLARGGKPFAAITDLARLVATRNYLDAGYRKAIWLDADMFIFDKPRLVLDFPPDSLPLGYAFAREVWVGRKTANGTGIFSPRAHNAAMYFTPEAVDLDMLITLTRHIGATRVVKDSQNLSIGLLRGLQPALMFPTFSHAALFSPTTVHAIAAGDESILQAYAKWFRYHACAANLCFSLPEQITEPVMMRAMDILEQSAGDAVNKFAPEPWLHLSAFDEAMPELKASG